jgi:hypothetical protein
MMMTEEIEKQAGELISLLGKELDVPYSKYKEAEDRYNALGKWLQRPDSLVAKFSPEIYVQGSFLLGTAIAPISEEGEYDLDSVCKLLLNTGSCSQQKLKELVGYEIKAYAKAQAMNKPAKEGRRCWTLNYSDDSRFHMDILPAIPNEEGFRLLLEKRGSSSDYTDNAISITDNECDTYSIVSNDWLISNPKGYAKWFREKMKQASAIMFSESRGMQKYGSVEEVPVHELRTPLQRVIQVLKRHRDIKFGDDEDKPISIIITTLATRAYRNQTDLLDALRGIVADMPQYIEVRNGEKWVPNPVNQTENFADKWKEHPQRERNFHKWHQELNEELNGLISETGGLQNFSEGMKKFAGEKVAANVLKEYAISMKQARQSGTLKATTGLGTLGVGTTSSSSATVKKHEFYGI